MTEPTPTYTAAALRTAFATAVDGVVRIPAGTYELDYPLRVPRPFGVVTGEGPRSSVLRAKSGVFTPLLVSLPAEADACPVTPAGLVYGDRGWFSFSDFCLDFPGAAFTLDLTVTLPSPLPAGEWALAACRGAFLHHDAPDTPYLLTVTPDGVLRYTFTSDALSRRYESAAGAVPLGQRVRLVCQFGGGRVRVWVVTAAASTLVIDSDHAGANRFPRHADHVVGFVPDRWPEGSGWLRPATGTTYHAVEIKAFALHDPANPPPAGSVTQDDLLGVYTAFQSPDGAFFRGTVAGLPAVFFWRAQCGDVAGGTAWVSGVGLFGGTAGLVLAHAHNWSVRDVHAGDAGRYGVLLQNQCYGGTLADVSVAAVAGVGIALCNNSSLVTLHNCHAEACGAGVVAGDSDALTLVGGWSDNNGTNLLVKGDNAAVAATGTSFGHEGAVGAHNVVLSNCASASFAGCCFLALTAPTPAVELDHCSGVVFTAPRFGMHPSAEAVLKVTNHDAARPVRVVGEGRRWAGAADAVPLVPVPPPTNVVVS